MTKSNSPGGPKLRAARSSHQQQPLFSLSDASATDSDVSSSACDIVSVGKRRDGGTRYWCVRHKADATAKYGKPAGLCRTAHIAPISAADTLALNIDKYEGGIALWGAVPPVYDTTITTDGPGHPCPGAHEGRRSEGNGPHGSRCANLRGSSARGRDPPLRASRRLLHGLARIRLRDEAPHLVVLCM